MLAITLVTVVVFFPVTLLFGVSKYLFTALALAVVILPFRFLLRCGIGGAALLRAISRARSCTCGRVTDAP